MEPTVKHGADQGYDCCFVHSGDCKHFDQFVPLAHTHDRKSSAPEQDKARQTNTSETSTPCLPHTHTLNPFPRFVSSFATRCSEEGIAVKGRPRAEFRVVKALTSAMKTLSANKEARLSVDCIDGDKDLA